MIEFIRPVETKSGVAVTIRAPLYFWHQLSGFMPVQINLKATSFIDPKHMFTREDFDAEGLECWGSGRTNPRREYFAMWDYVGTIDAMIAALNHCKLSYVKREESRFYRQMVMMLPETYIYERRILLTSDIVALIAQSAMNKEFDQWNEFLAWAGKYFYDILTGESVDGYTVQEIAKMFGVTDACIRAWIKKGILKKKKQVTDGKTFTIEAAEIVRFVNENPKYNQKLSQLSDLNSVGGNTTARNFYILHKNEIRKLEGIA